jgi:hypothetical protein
VLFNASGRQIRLSLQLSQLTLYSWVQELKGAVSLTVCRCTVISFP